MNIFRRLKKMGWPSSLERGVFFWLTLAFAAFFVNSYYLMLHEKDGAKEQKRLEEANALLSKELRECKALHAQRDREDEAATVKALDSNSMREFCRLEYLLNKRYEVPLTELCAKKKKEWETVK